MDIKNLACIVVFLFISCSKKIYVYKPLVAKKIENLPSNEFLVKSNVDSVRKYLRKNKLYEVLKNPCLDNEIFYMRSLDGYTKQFSSFRIMLLEKLNKKQLEKLKLLFENELKIKCGNTYKYEIEYNQNSNLELIDFILSKKKS